MAFDKKAYIKAWRLANQDKIRENGKAYRARVRKLKKWPSDTRQWKKRLYPMAVAARNAVFTALQAGKLTKPEVCEACGKRGLIHGHHDDYSKPLDVRWLCPPCHNALHKELI